MAGMDARGLWRSGTEETLGVFPILYRIEAITSRKGRTYALGRMVGARIASADGVGP